ncbi:hypothetical protein E4U21_006383 [Claviceps maximensis]|nr:hypothetical protein E4U21_006383 [Claviceps maximensis]
MKFNAILALFALGASATPALAAEAANGYCCVGTVSGAAQGYYVDRNYGQGSFILGKCIVIIQKASASNCDGWQFLRYAGDCPSKFEVKPASYCQAHPPPK